MSCECQLPEGATKLFCDRHKCTKYKRLVELCAAGAQGAPRARDYWQAWEKGDGPGQAKPEEKESTVNKLARPTRYAKAIARWEAAGSPVRSDDEVLRIYAICETCKFFADNRCTHKTCGCSVLPPVDEKATLAGLILPQGFANKLRMATEKCPVRKWTSTALP